MVNVVVHSKVVVAVADWLEVVVVEVLVGLVVVVEVVGWDEVVDVVEVVGKVVVLVVPVEVVVVGGVVTV